MLQQYFIVYIWLFKELILLNKKAVVNIFITYNISFLLSIGQIVIYAIVLQALLGVIDVDFVIILSAVFVISILYNTFMYITNTQQAKLAIQMQKKCHSDILVNVSNLNLNTPDIKKLANRGARLTGQSVDDIFKIINYLIYSLLISAVMIYLNFNIFLWIIVTIIFMAPLIYISKKHTNRISKKFFHPATEALSVEFNKQFKKDKFNPLATKFRYFFKVFYEYKIISEKMGLSIKTLQSFVIVVVLYFIYNAYLHGDLKNSEPIIYLFLVKNFASYLQNILSALTNLIKYYSIVKQLKFNLDYVVRKV